jgi:predicted DNA-binding transcriptional regulator AlpA
MKLLTKQEVADVLRVSVRTLSVYMSKGLLPPHRCLGRRLLWLESDILLCVQVSRDCVRRPLEDNSVKRGRPRKLIS